ncbi:MAG: DUF3971 domain-containing protein [Pseudomonadota bacterium]|nr:DUF3971 domain-containing protein [Pseudomonadota bacterium]
MIRTSRLFLRMTAGAFTVLGILVALLAGRLSQGPISMEFLATPMEQALNRPDAPFRMEFGKTFLAWDEVSRSLEVRVQDFRTRKPDGSVLATIPALGIRFSVPALMQGQYVPQSINLIGPRLALVRTEEGQFRLDLPSGENAAAPEGRAAMEVLLNFLSPERNASAPVHMLKEVRVTRATVVVDDRALGLTWKTDEVSLWIDRTEKGLKGRGRVRLRLPGQDTLLNASFVQEPDTGVVAVTARFRGLNAASLGRLSDSMAPLQTLNMPLDGSLTLTLSPQMTLDSATLQVDGRNGILQAHREAAPVPVEYALLEVRAAQAGEVSIDRFLLDMGSSALQVRGEATRTGTAWRAGLDVSLTGLPVKNLDSVWPVDVAPNPRRWVVENLVAGEVQKAWAAAKISFAPADMAATTLNSLTGEIRFSDVTARYFGKLPPAADLSGTAQFDASTFRVTVAGGRLEGMRIGPSSIRITGLDAKDQDIRIEAPARGPLGEALRILDFEPLGYATKFGISPAAAGGTADIVTTFSFPLLADLDMDQVGIKVTADVRNGSLAKAVNGWDLTGARMDLAVDATRMTVSGTAALAGVPLQAEWTEDFRDGAPWQTALKASARLSERDRKNLGVDFMPYIAGTVPVRAEYRKKDRTSPAVMDIRADLEDTPVRIPFLGFSGRGGAGAKATAGLVFHSKGLSSVRDIDITLAGIRARGSAEFDDSGRLGRLVLGDIRGPGTAMSFRMDRKGQDGFSVKATGSRLNLGPFMEDRKSTPEEKDGDEETPSIPLDVTLSLDEITLGKGRRMTQISGSGSRNGNGWQTMELNAWTGDRKPLIVRYEPRGDVQELEVETSDAGTVLAVAGVSDSISGGVMSVTGRSRPGDVTDTVRGSVEITGFDVRDAPGLARLLNALSFRGLGELLSGGGTLRFDRLASDFRWDDTGITLASGKAAGSAIGLTFDGRVDLDAEMIDLQGTIVPVYGINQFLGAIPILGTLLTGGEGQGLFAATYTIQGPLDDPDVSVNPLSALAPGFLRNIFFMDIPAKVDSP